MKKEQNAVEWFYERIKHHYPIGDEFEAMTLAFAIANSKYNKEIRENKKMDKEQMEYIVWLLKEYARVEGMLPRCTSDLSPLEQWLLLRLNKLHNMELENQKNNTKD